MKIDTQSKYFKITVCMVGGICFLLIFISILWHFDVLWGKFWSLIWRFLYVIKPLLLGCGIAYLLDPIVEKYIIYLPEKKFFKNRVWAVLCTYLSLLFFLGVLVGVAVLNIQQIMVKNQLDGAMLKLSDWLNYFETMFENVNMLANKFHLSHMTSTIFKTIYTKLYAFIQYFTTHMVDCLTKVGTHLVSIFLGVMIAFYLLIDKEKILTTIHKFLEKICTRKLGKELRALAKEADLIFSGYIRGTLMDALVVGTLISISLMLLGLDLALLIGVIAGIFNIIPYFGPFVGMALGGLLGFVSSVPQKGLYAVGIIFLIQQLDSWYIVPKIVGQNVKLPPLLVLLSIVIGGNLFGLIGILLAVPVTAFLKWLILRYGNDWIN